MIFKHHKLVMSQPISATIPSSRIPTRLLEAMAEATSGGFVEIEAPDDDIVQRLEANVATRRERFPGA